MESNDSPEIPDRGETSDIPGLPSEEEATVIFRPSSSRNQEAAIFRANRKPPSQIRRDRRAEQRNNKVRFTVNSSNAANVYVSRNCVNTVSIGIRTLEALQTTKMIQAEKTDKHTDDSRSVGDSSSRATRLTPNASTTRLLSDPTYMTAGSDSNSVLESRPSCSVDTAKLKENEIAGVEKITV